MLELLRKASRGWFFKGFLLLLVASFGVWGVQSSIFAPANDAVISVGDQKVSNNEFRFAFGNAMANLSQQLGQRLTVEQAKLFGVENAVVSQLTAGAALDQLAEDMQLGLSEERLLQVIQEERGFRDETGAFNRRLMEQRLAAAGMRIEDYINAKSKEAVRSQIADALTSGFEPPKVLVEALEAYANERRSIDYMILTKDNVDPVAPPAADVLEKWFNDNKAKYKAPEFRKVTYVKLEPADIANPQAITDEQVKEDYEKHKDKYRTPETRTIEQLTFADKAAADAAAAKLASGTTFDQLVLEQGKTPTDVLLGDFTKETMPTPAMAEAAFGVKEDGGVTPVTDGLLGPVILRVTNIRPEVVKSIEEVEDEIRKELALVLANDEIQNVYNAFEDARASGDALDEAARKQQLKAVTLEAVDAAGRGQDENEIEGIPEARKLLAEVFKTDPGTEPLPLHLANGGYVWFEVNDIMPERDRTLDEVKDRVMADWTAEQQRLALAKKAEEVAANITKGTKMEDAAAELKVAVETKNDLRRGMNDAVLGTVAINAAFNGPDGHVASAPGADGETQIVLRVTNVSEQPTADVLDNTAERVRAMARAAGEDVLTQLVDALETQYGSSYNRTLANQLMVR